MKNIIKNSILSILVAINIILLIAQQTGCSSSKIPHTYPIDTLTTNSSENGFPIELIFKRGEAHNNPLMAIWITDTNNKYIETLYIAKSIARGVFEHGDKSQGKWMPGPIRRPATLPVWSHSRGVKEHDNLYVPTQNTPMPDAISGATPPSSFVLRTKTSKNTPEIFYLYFEINQSWDWNEYWTNNKYPNDAEYKTSCQPALVYKTVINKENSPSNQILKLIGHSHYSGKNGNIYNETETITTAHQITESIMVKY